jgi:hypothetical protein
MGRWNAVIFYAPKKPLPIDEISPFTGTKIASRVETLVATGISAAFRINDQPCLFE